MSPLPSPINLAPGMHPPPHSHDGGSDRVLLCQFRQWFQAILTGLRQVSGGIFIRQEIPARTTTAPTYRIGAQLFRLSGIGKGYVRAYANFRLFGDAEYNSNVIQNTYRKIAKATPIDSACQRTPLFSRKRPKTGTAMNPAQGPFRPRRSQSAPISSIWDPNAIQVAGVIPPWLTSHVTSRRSPSPGMIRPNQATCTRRSRSSPARAVTRTGTAAKPLGKRGGVLAGSLIGVQCGFGRSSIIRDVQISESALRGSHPK